MKQDLYCSNVPVFGWRDWINPRKTWR